MKKNIKLFYVLLFMVFAFMGFGISANAADSNKTEIIAGKKFILKYHQAIQGYSKGGNYMYIQQAYSKNTIKEFVAFKTTDDKNENLVLLTRCKFNKKKNGYVPNGYMLLSNVGHGQTIESYNHNGKNYLLISCGSRATSMSTLWWSNEIGRIEFKAGAYVKNSEIKRITNLNYNTYPTMRVDAALTPDKKILAIWQMNGSGQSKYIGYDFSKINKIFDNMKVNEVDARNLDIRNAMVFSTKNIGLNIPSYQGFAIHNSNNGKYTVYISSGDDRKYAICIYKYEINNGNIIHNKTIRLNTQGIWKAYTSNNKKVEAEIESIKIIGNDLQFVLRNTGNAKQQLLCKMSQNAFK